MSSNYTIASSNAYVKLSVYDTFCCIDSEIHLLEVFWITGFQKNDSIVYMKGPSNKKINLLQKYLKKRPLTKDLHLQNEPQTV